MEPEFIEIPLKMYKKDNMWIVSIGNVTSGFTVHTEVDSSRIEFRYDASRFRPYFKTK